MTFTDPPPFAAFEHRDSRVGFEIAFFRMTAGGVLIEGHTAAVHEGEPCAVAYTIELHRRWRTRWASVRARLPSGPCASEIKADGDGRLTVDGEPAPSLDDCLDLDQESSAVTNAFPVRRLALRVGGRADTPDGGLRLAYAAPRFDLRSELEYDRSGLVVAYPGVAVRRA